MDAARRLKALLRKGTVFLDGAMGTRLAAFGMPAGTSPERWAAGNPRVLEGIHREYLQAGSDVVLSCTFGGTEPRLGEPPERLNTLLAEALLRAVEGRAVPGASVGPTGLLLHPMGPLRWNDAYRLFHRQALALCKAGLRVFFLETFSDPRELKAAVLAVRDACPDGFISAQMSFGEDGYTLSGTSPQALAALGEQIPADAVGVNCSVGPDSLVPVLRAMAEWTAKPLAAEPNAGMPDHRGKHSMDPVEFATRCEDLAWSGAALLGGCCGTGPEHIHALRSLTGRQPPRTAPPVRKRALSSMTRLVPLGHDTVLVGEAVNPTGRPDLRKALRSGDTAFVLSLAGSQVHAHVLDINLGLERMLPEGFVSDLFAGLAPGPPLSVDLSDPVNIETAFRELGGIGLLNSLTCDPAFMEARVETLKRHGGYAVLLPLGPGGVPDRAEERVLLVRRGMGLLREMGLPRWRVVADPVVNSVASGGSCAATLETLAKMKAGKWLTIAGVSNVSHGLPRRRALNLALLVRLAEGGLDLAIADALRPETPLALRGGRLLSGGLDPEMEALPDSGEFGNPLEEAILRGDPREAVRLAEEMLERGVTPGELVETHLQRAMTRLGGLFQARKAFLPHLIAGAEAARALTDLLAPRFARGEARSRGTVVLATVQGDRHDIGKNLVGLFLRGAGYRVVDLGKDVPGQRILEAVLREKPLVLALSALMSSTASRMEEVIRLLREKGLSVPVLIGGAVISGDYAEKIGALYAREAFNAVKVLEGLAAKGSPLPPDPTGTG